MIRVVADPALALPCPWFVVVMVVVVFERALQDDHDVGPRWTQPTPRTQPELPGLS